MKKTLTTTTGVIMLANPLMLFAGSLSLDDAYLDEGPGAFSTPTAGSHDVGRTNLITSEMYAWEAHDAYNSALQEQPAPNEPRSPFLQKAPRNRTTSELHA